MTTPTFIFQKQNLTNLKVTVTNENGLLIAPPSGNVTIGIEFPNTSINTTGPYDIATYVEGVTSNAEVIMTFVLPRAIIIKATVPFSQARANNAATSNATFTCAKNGTSFCTITWKATNTLGSFTANSDTSFIAGDILTITGPNPADATLAYISITLAGIRQ